jgi:hypothetical protein
LFGCTIACVILFSKVFKERIAHPLFTNLSWFHLSIYSIISLSFFISFIYTAVNIMRYYGSSKYIIPKNKLTSYLLNVYVISLKSFDKFVKENIIIFWALWCFSFLKILHKINIYYFITIIFIFNYLPRLMFAISFLVDVFVFKEFYYSYKFAALLLLPLISIYLLYTLESVCLINLMDLDKMFTVFGKNQKIVLTPPQYIMQFIKYIPQNNFKKISTLFKLDYLSSIHLEDFQFSWNDYYLQKNKDVLKVLTDDEIFQRFNNEYFQDHQIFMLSSFSQLFRVK